MKLILAEIFDPTTLLGGLFYAVIFLVLAFLLSSIIRKYTQKIITREQRHPNDQTAIMFIAQLLQVGSFVVAAILYFHLIPALKSFGTALLTTASVISIVVGLAAQNTLGNLIAGVSLLLYRPFRLGDRIQVSAPTGVETGIVRTLSLGYTMLESLDNRKIIIPNSVMSNNVIINLGQKE